MCLLPGGGTRLRPRIWGRGPGTELFVHRIITCFCGYCLFIAVETWVVLLAIPGLVLVGEATVKRGSLRVLDMGLDVSVMVLTLKDALGAVPEIMHSSM